MIKKTKLISLVLCGLIIYTFFGGMTFAAMDGITTRCHTTSTRAKYHCHPEDRRDLSIIWPITVTVWVLGNIGTVIGEFGGQVYDEIT